MSIQKKKTINDLMDKIASTVGHIHILSKFSSSFGPAINRCGNHVNCPHPNCHSRGTGENDFRLDANFDSNGRIWCSCFRNNYTDTIGALVWDGVFRNTAEAAKGIDDYLSGRDVYALPSRVSLPATPRTPEENLSSKNTPEKIEWRKNLNRGIEKNTIGLDYAISEPARKYLINRGIYSGTGHYDYQELGFIPCLPLFAKGKRKIGDFPAIVSKVRDPDGVPVCFHQIIITPEGHKASLGEDQDRQKSTSLEVVAGTLKGSAVRIRTRSNRTLHVGEGVELMFAISQCVPSDDSVWSAMNAPNLGNLILRREMFDSVIIWVDKDFGKEIDGEIKGEAGQKAAYKLAKRLTAEGFYVTVMYIKQAITEDGMDWEDIIVDNKVLKLKVEDRHLALSSLAMPEWFDIGLKNINRWNRKVA